MPVVRFLFAVLRVYGSVIEVTEIPSSVCLRELDDEK